MITLKRFSLILLACFTLVFVIFVSWFFVFLVKREPMYHSFNIDNFSKYPYSLSEIKTGDLILQRSKQKKWLTRALWGCALTHVGVFHRCMHTGKLKIFDVYSGIHYTAYEDTLLSYEGDLFIRPLKQPLDNETLALTQDLIDTLFLHANYEGDTRNVFIRNESRSTSIPSVYCGTKTALRENPFDVNRTEFPIQNLLSSCVSRHIFGKDSSNDYALVCTDVIFILLQKWGIININEIATCIEPDWFAFPGYSKELDTAYGDMTILKDFRLKRIPNGKLHIILNDITVRFT